MTAASERGPRSEKRLAEVVEGQSRVDHVLHDQHVAALEGGVQILEEPDRGRAAGLGRRVAGELDEVDVVQDRQRARQVGEEDEARLQRPDEQRLPALVVVGDLRAELGDACRDLIRGEVDLADPGRRVGLDRLQVR